MLIGRRRRRRRLVPVDYTKQRRVPARLTVCILIGMKAGPDAVRCSCRCVAGLRTRRSRTVVEPPLPAPRGRHLARRRRQLRGARLRRGRPERHLSVGSEGNITFPLVGVIARRWGSIAQAAAKRIADRLRAGHPARSAGDRARQGADVEEDLHHRAGRQAGHLQLHAVDERGRGHHRRRRLHAAGGEERHDHHARRERARRRSCRCPSPTSAKGGRATSILQPGDIISVPERIF